MNGNLSYFTFIYLFSLEAKNNLEQCTEQNTEKSCSKLLYFKNCKMFYIHIYIHIRSIFSMYAFM